MQVFCTNYFKIIVWVDMLNYLVTMTSVTDNLCKMVPSGQNFNKNYLKGMLCNFVLVLRF